MTATDFPTIFAAGHPAPAPVLADILLSWQPGTGTAAIRPVGAGGVLEMPWYVRIGADRLAELAHLADVGADGLLRLRVRRDLP